VGSDDVPTTAGLTKGRPAAAGVEPAGHLIESDRIGRVLLVAIGCGQADQLGEGDLGAVVSSDPGLCSFLT